MGITPTGDIILILKYAKEVGGRMATDKALEGSRREITVVSSAAIPSTTTSVAPKKPMPSLSLTSRSTSALPKEATVAVLILQLGFQIRTGPFWWLWDGPDFKHHSNSGCPTIGNPDKWQLSCQKTFKIWMTGSFGLTLHNPTSKSPVFE